MRNTFSGHFRPKQQEFNNHWENSIFVVDANVLLNLYRYSEATRTELQEAIRGLNGRVYIPNQAAHEFFRNRLSVTSDQSKEYTSAIKTIRDLVKKISSKERHPFIKDEMLIDLTDLSDKVIDNLEKQQGLLLDKLSNDEILEFIEDVFKGKTGPPYETEKLNEIIELGERRYETKTPPGFKDINKDSTTDPLRKYGDLIVWLQTIDYAKDQSKSVVFITDDKKEDWWLEQSGRTISPRPELIEEFQKETEQQFWMYSVGKFIQETAKRNKKEVNPDIIDEIRKISERIEQMSQEGLNIKLQSIIDTPPSIQVSQETNVCNKNENTGIIIVTLAHNMRYATGSGKFIPKLISVPDFEVEFIECPESCSKEQVHISYGCGTTKDFNVHLKAKKSELPAGDYVFNYRAISDDDTFDVE